MFSILKLGSITGNRWNGMIIGGWFGKLCINYLEVDQCSFLALLSMICIRTVAKDDGSKQCCNTAV